MTDSNHGKIEVVVIKDSLKCWEMPGTSKLFSEMVGLRKRGYLAQYPCNVLPYDTYDFVSTQVMFLEKTQGESRPVVSFRFVPNDVCRNYRLEFPGLLVPRGSGAKEHEDFVKKILLDADRVNHNVAYVGFWTIDPNTRKDKDWTSMLRNAVIGVHVLYQMENKIDEAVLCGVLRVKAPLFQKRIGYIPFSNGSGELPPFNQSSLLDEPVIMLHMKEFSEEAKALAEEFRPIWESRVEINSQAETEPVKKAA